MAKPRPCKPAEAIRKIALSYPETEEGTSCNKASFKAGKKAFVYLGVGEETYNVMLKLRESLAEAKQLAKKHPGRFSPGSNGWVQMKFPFSESAPAGVMKRWIDESFRVLVPKKIVALLPERESPKVEKTAKKKAATRHPPRPWRIVRECSLQSARPTAESAGIT